MKKFLLQEINYLNVVGSSNIHITKSAMYDSFDETMAEAEKECLAEYAFLSDYSNGLVFYRKAAEYNPIHAVFSIYNSDMDEVNVWFITELNI